MLYALILFIAVIGFSAAMLCALAFAVDLYNETDDDDARERIRLGLTETNRRTFDQ